MEQENTITESKDPVDMTVKVVYRIHSFKELAEDIVEAIKLFNDLPGDLASRRFANDMFCSVLSKVVAKQSDSTAVQHADADDDLGTDAQGNQIY